MDLKEVKLMQSKLDFSVSGLALQIAPGGWPKRQGLVSSPVAAIK
jgi:hypothetical protein